jgi:putative membrane protein
MRITDTALMADGWPYHHAGTGGWIAMVLVMVIFWGAIGALIVVLVRGGFTSRSDTPHDTLRHRLAEGEISVAEYEQRRAALDSSTDASSNNEDPRAGSSAGPPTASTSPQT